MPELHLCCFLAAAGPPIWQLHLRGAVQGTDLQAQESWSLLEADYFRLLAVEPSQARLDLFHNFRCACWALLDSMAEPVPSSALCLCRQHKWGLALVCCPARSSMLF